MWWAEERNRDAVRPAGTASGRARRFCALATAAIAATIATGCADTGFRPLYGTASIGGADVSEKLTQVDIAPTLFHLLSLPIPQGWWGQSLFFQEKNNPLIGVFRDSLYLAGQVDMRVPVDRPNGADEQALINLFNSVYH